MLCSILSPSSHLLHGPVVMLFSVSIVGGIVTQIPQISDLGSHHQQVVEARSGPRWSESQALNHSCETFTLKILSSNPHSF